MTKNSGINQAVFRQGRIDLLFEVLRDLVEVLVDLEDVDVLLADGLGEVGFHLGHHQGLELANHAGEGVIVPHQLVLA
jgi:hypothetical protein